VGDPMQLPATTKSRTATKTGFDKSTMESLINNNVSYRMLEYQYRMAPEIRSFPSKFFYQDRLEDGGIISTRNNPYANVELFPYSVVDIESGTEKKIRIVISILLNARQWYRLLINLERIIQKYKLESLLFTVRR
jgi:superfamily I DNA and/or RNA helicase